MNVYNIINHARRRLNEIILSAYSGPHMPWIWYGHFWHIFYFMLFSSSRIAQTHKSVCVRTAVCTYRTGCIYMLVAIAINMYLLHLLHLEPRKSIQCSVKGTAYRTGAMSVMRFFYYISLHFRRNTQHIRCGWIYYYLYLLYKQKQSIPTIYPSRIDHWGVWYITPTM